MNIKGKTICFECMNLSDDVETCTHCGAPIPHNVPKQDFSNVLRPGSILQNSYVVGKAFYTDGFIVRYLGLDVINECPVNIIELFPWDLSERHDDGITVIHGKNPDGFEKVTTRFQRRIAAITKIDLNIMEKVISCFVENGTTYVISTGIPQDAPSLSQVVEEANQISLNVVKEMALNIRLLHNSGFYVGLINADEIRVIGGSALLPLTFPEFSRYSTKDLHTSPYIAPEVFEGVGIGPQSDVYSICALLYSIMRKKPLADAFERSRQSKDVLVKELKRARASTELSQAMQKGLLLDSEVRSDTLDEILPLIDTIHVSPKIKKKNPSAAEQKESNSKKIFVKRNLIIIALLIIGLTFSLTAARAVLRKMKNDPVTSKNTEIPADTQTPVKTASPDPTPEATGTPTPTPEISATPEPEETNVPEEEEIDRVGDDTMPVDPLYEEDPTMPPEEEQDEPEPTETPAATQKPKKTMAPKKTAKPQKTKAPRKKVIKKVTATKRPQQYTPSKPKTTPKRKSTKPKKPVVKVEPGDGTDLDWIK